RPAIVDRLNTKNGNLRNSAHLVERAAGSAIDQPLVGHILEKRLKRDLIIAVKAERPGDLALTRRLVGRSDEIEDLLTSRKTAGFALGHLIPLPLMGRGRGGVMVVHRSGNHRPHSTRIAEHLMIPKAKNAIPLAFDHTSSRKIPGDV